MRICRKYPGVNAVINKKKTFDQNKMDGRAKRSIIFKTIQ